MKFSGLELPAESILPWKGQSVGVSIGEGTATYADWRHLAYLPRAPVPQEPQPYLVHTFAFRK